MSDEAVYRTAPATPGLLKTENISLNEVINKIYTTFSILAS